ncbi:PREDICTED: uncharacterized protein LOC104800579 isoform X3 [Tarenaya hassleriana]|uniref:uncharacterized protein LOC104800579 isoform X3 n=1 Tax=Tarenaya hassleriana TaxID=28532 RepID=UPI00053C67C7|nr:PREDICTED: uncharacterized protein LOC104800579 isoform X3 [Tarenaya hassleriana]
MIPMKTRMEKKLCFLNMLMTARIRHGKMNEISGEEDIQEWGLSMFGDQEIPPALVLPELGSCCLFKDFTNNEMSSMVDLTGDKGGILLEGLLKNGWLTRLVLTCAHAETLICKWTLNLLLYSSKEELRSSACDFWCSILESQKEVNGRPVKIDWLPSYHEIKGALETYGFQFSSSPNSNHANTDFESQGPPQSIRAWITFVAACCQTRGKKRIFAISQAEQLAEVTVWLLLDRRLLGLSLLLHDCLESIVGYFKEGEWVCSCKKITNSLASRVPSDINCLKMVESISGVDARSKHLRSALANQMLMVLLEHREANEEEILSSLVSINVKEKGCDLFKTYISMALAENWLLHGSLLEEKPVLKEMWGVFLRNCSCQINSTDLRAFASKIRTKASYLLQGCVIN